MTPPILITGLPRSGTSCVTETLHRCGMWVGECRGRDERNAKGYWENESIKQLTNKAMLKLAGFDALGIKPLPENPLGMPLPSHVLEGLMQKQGYGGGPWGFKDPKTLLCWPAWDEAFPDASWVLVSRCSTGGDLSRYISGFDPPVVERYSHFQWELIGHLSRKKKELHIVVSPQAVKKTARKLGLEWTEEAGQVFDPALWDTQVA